MQRNFLPADATIEELKQKAADYDEQASKAEEPQATKLRNRAKYLRAWIAELSSGRWTSVR